MENLVEKIRAQIQRNSRVNVDDRIIERAVKYIPNMTEAARADSRTELKFGAPDTAQYADGTLSLQWLKEGKYKVTLTLNGRGVKYHGNFNLRG